MKIAGLQKLTLLDYPGKVAATVFVPGCDLRCPYCHNAQIWSSSAASLEWEDVLSFLKERKHFLDGVCITGGEPLLQGDLASSLREIRALGLSIKLDTNGTRPQVLEKLLEESLVDYVAMDIKSDPVRYAMTTNCPQVDLEAIRASVALIQRQAVHYEFRTTVTKRFHDESSFEQIGQWVAGAESYALQPFAVSANVPDPTLGTPDAEEMRTYAEILRRTVQKVEIRGMDLT